MGVYAPKGHIFYLWLRMTSGHPYWTNNNGYHSNGINSNHSNNGIYNSKYNSSLRLLFVPIILAYICPYLLYMTHITYIYDQYYLYMYLLLVLLIIMGPKVPFIGIIISHHYLQLKVISIIIRSNSINVNDGLRPSLLGVNMAF